MVLSIDFLRYFIGAGLIWLLLGLLPTRWLEQRRILHGRPRPGQMRREFGYSLATVLIFASTGVMLFLMTQSGWVDYGTWLRAAGPGGGPAWP
jgi:hypothetical protein